MRGAVEHGVPAIGMLGNGLGNATLSLGNGLGHTTLAIGNGLGHTTLAVGSGVGSDLMGLGNAAVEPGVPASRMIGNGLGNATIALGNGVGQSLTGLANVAAEHGPPLARAAIDGVAYQGSRAFQALYNAIKRLPPIPSLEMSEYNGGNALVSYQPLRNQKRSNSPGRASRSAAIDASVSASAPSHRPNVGPETVVFNTFDEWKKYSPGRSLLGEQLKLRPQFRTAATGKQATAKWLKSLTPSDMIQLLLMLDGKD